MMRIFIKSVLLILCLVTLGHAQASKPFDIKVEVKNAKNNHGKMFFALHDNENDFLKKEIRGAVKAITNNASMAIFKNVPAGTYAVSIFHDENDNGKLDTNSLGIPNEPYGCSNNAKGFMGPPKWKNAKFELKDKDQNLIINL
jgi:uncharacterized protein (DUF2141 family)